MCITVNGGDVGDSADRDTDVLFTGTCQKFLFAFLSNTVYLTYAAPTSSPNPLLLDAYNASASSVAQGKRKPRISEAFGIR